jgi:hypothetical protein
MKLSLCFVVLWAVSTGCSLLNGGDCSSGIVVTVDGGTDALPSDGAISTSTDKCRALCGGSEYSLCKLKDATHVLCIPPCE